MKKLFYFLVVLTMMLSCDKEKLTITNGVKDRDDVVLVDDIVTFTVEGVTFRMVKVEGGTFQRGPNGYLSEPVSVTLSDYYIGATEVTQDLWVAVMGGNPSHFQGDNLPVEQVNWDYCQNFISRLNQMTGKRFALPTEAQWEYAERGGNKSCAYRYYSGSDNIDDVAWYKDNSSEQTHPVGTKMANELGLYDMSGNVWEWCSDWYGEYSSSPQTDPTGPQFGSDRVLRGGSWYNNAGDCCSGFRYHLSPGYSSSDLGLRLVLLF